MKINWELEVLISFCIGEKPLANKKLKKGIVKNV